MPYAAGFAPALQRSVTPQCVSNSAGSYAAVAGRQRGLCFNTASVKWSVIFCKPPLSCSIEAKRGARVLFLKDAKGVGKQPGSRTCGRSISSQNICLYGRPSVASREATACSEGPIREGRHKGVSETPAVPCAMYLVAMCLSSSWRQVSRRGIS